MDKPPVRFDDPDEVGRMVEAFNALELAKAELAKEELAKAADSHHTPEISFSGAPIDRRL
jgi:hypothetical protein